MQRRDLLRTVACGLAGLSAGCQQLGTRSVTLASPEVRSDEGGLRQTLTYRHDESAIADVGFIQANRLDRRTDQFRFKITIPHSNDTEITRFEIDLRAPRARTRPAADTYLESPPPSVEDSLRFYEIENSWTRIAVSESTSFGESTVRLPLIIGSNSVGVEAIALRGRVTLSPTSRNPIDTYELKFDRDFEVVVAK